jgi:hypothetical protein
MNIVCKHVVFRALDTWQGLNSDGRRRSKVMKGVCSKTPSASQAAPKRRPVVHFVLENNGNVREDLNLGEGSMACEAIFMDYMATARLN